MKKILLSVVLVFLLVGFIALVFFVTPIGGILSFKRSEVKLIQKIKKNPADSEAYRNLRILYIERGKYKRALKISKKELSLDTTNARLCLFIADLFYALEGEHYRDSINKYLSLSFAFTGNERDILPGIAEGYERIGKTGKAIEVYRTLLLFMHGDTLMIDNMKIYKESYHKKIENRIKELTKKQSVQSG